MINTVRIGQHPQSMEHPSCDEFVVGVLSYLIDLFCLYLTVELQPKLTSYYIQVSVDVRISERSRCISLYMCKQTC